MEKMKMTEFEKVVKAFEQEIEKNEYPSDKLDVVDCFIAALSAVDKLTPDVRDYVSKRQEHFNQEYSSGKF